MVGQYTIALIALIAVVLTGGLLFFIYNLLAFKKEYRVSSTTNDSEIKFLKQRLDLLERIVFREHSTRLSAIDQMIRRQNMKEIIKESKK